MEINNPNELIQAIQTMLMQMNKPQRKLFLKWVKAKRNDFDFNYPNGYVFKEGTNEKPSIVVTDTNAQSELIDTTAESTVSSPVSPADNSGSVVASQSDSHTV